MENDTFETQFGRLKALGKIALIGIPFLIASAFLGETTARSVMAILGLLVILPVTIYCYCLTILHWKARYRGVYSNFWGVILLIETSGWFKMVYLFRHLLPDMFKKGRYANEEANNPLNPIPETTSGTDQR